MKGAISGAITGGVKGGVQHLKTVAQAANTPSFSGGDAGEAHLKEMVGGESQVKFDTSKGVRYVDQLADRVAHEVKVGYNSLSQAIRKQILKDAELKATELVKDVVWHFFRSANTEKIGATKSVLDFLTEHGIKYIIHH